MWINQNFLLPSEISAENNTLDVKFLSLRTETTLALKMTSNGEVIIRLCNNNIKNLSIQILLLSIIINFIL